MKRFLIILWVALLSGCGLSAKEKATVNELTSDMQTQCIGRHLIDLPKGFDPMFKLWASFMPASVRSESAAMIEPSIQGVGVMPEQFRKAVETRRAELAADENMLSKDSMLRDVRQVGENQVMLRADRSGLSEDAFRSELHLLIEDAYVVIKEESYNNEYREAEQRIVDFSKNIARIRSVNSPQKGFCIGPIVIAGDYSTEQAMFAFRNPAYPDILISVDIDTYGRDDSETLLQRVSGPGSLLSIFGVGHNVLRKGELKVADMRAQEWLVSFEEGDHKDHKFALETMRPKVSPAQPQITIEFTTGQQGLDGERHTASLSDKEAMAVWDAMVKSIRLRPGAI